MKIAIIKELISYENRVAITPDVVNKFKQMNFTVLTEDNAGLKAGFTNEHYIKSGAEIVSREKALQDANIIVSVNAISEKDISILTPNKILIGNYSVYNNAELIKLIEAKQLQLLSLELMPRISRAQSMDILSSQNNLAGYKAVLVASNYFKKALPLMMTAAGMISPAKVFVMGTGVAGLQAIATAKRLGAVVSAYDVRAATKEQVESLGAKFLVVDEDALKDSETKTGYAKEMSSDYKAKEQQILFDHISKQDIIITTALIPGKKAPVLVTAEMVKNMPSGSVVVDLAASNGGNCELTEYDKVVEKYQTTIVGSASLVSEIATTASNLFANNIFNLIKSYYKKDEAFSFNYEDEIIKAILVTKKIVVTNK